MRQPQIQVLDIPIPETADLERQVLADLTNYQDAMGDVLPLMHPSFFTSDDRRGIWETMVAQYNRGESFDLATLGAMIGPVFVREVVPSTGHDEGRLAVMAHAALLRNGATRRRAYFSAASFIRDAASPSATEQEILAGLQAFAAQVEGPAPMNTETSSADAVREVREEARAIETLIKQNKTTRIATGFKYLDKTLNGGLKPGQLAVIAARPGVGKTSIMLSIAKHAAAAGFPVYISTLEMTTEELGEKLVFSTGKVRPFEIAGGRVDWTQFDEAQKEISALPISINQYSRTLDDIVGRIAQAVKRGKCKVAMIDYLGLIQDCNEFGPSAKVYQVIARITGTLKTVAKRLGITIILLSQLNRDNVRDKRSPELYDLRDSGSIEQDADVVIMLEYDPKERRIVAWLRKSRNGRNKDEKGRDFGFPLYPNETYSDFYEVNPEIDPDDLPDDHPDWGVPTINPYPQPKPAPADPDPDGLPF